MKPHQGFSRSEWIFLALLAATQFNHIVDFVIMMPLGEIIMRSLSVTPKQFSLLVAIYTFSASMSAVVSTFVADRYDRKSFLLFFYSGFILSTFACAFSSSFETLLAARALAGFFGGVIGSIVLAMASDHFPFERRGEALGILMGSFALASILGVPAGLFLANLFDWHIPFIAVGLLSMLVMLLIVLKVPSMRHHLADSKAKRENPRQVLTRIFTTRDQFVALLFMFVLNLGQFSIIPFIAPSLVSNAGLPEEKLHLLYLIGGCTSFVASFWVGKLADRYGKRPVFLGSMIISFVPVALITNMGLSPLWLIFGITSAFFVVMSGRNVPAAAMCSSATDHRHRGSFMSFLSAVQNLGAGLASVIAGAIVVRSASGQLIHFEVVGYFSMAMALVAMAASFLLRLPEQKS